MYIIHTMKRTNFHLTDLQIKRLRNVAKQTGLSVAELIRRAVDEWLEEYERNKGK